MFPFITSNDNVISIKTQTDTTTVSINLYTVSFKTTLDLIDWKNWGGLGPPLAPWFHGTSSFENEYYCVIDHTYYLYVGQHRWVHEAAGQCSLWGEEQQAGHHKQHGQTRHHRRRILQRQNRSLRRVHGGRQRNERDFQVIICFIVLLWHQKYLTFFSACSEAT